MQSESIAKLTSALVQVQAKLKGAKKDSDNPFFKSKYADLESVWEACRQLLADNGLAVIQMPSNDPVTPDVIGVETLMTHTSGEWVSSVLSVKPSKTDAQAAGSVITYLRRYMLQSFVGITPEDDDGEASMERKAPQPVPAKAPAPAKAAPKAAPTTADKPKIEPGSPAAMFMDYRLSAIKAVGKSDDTSGRNWFNDYWKAAAKSLNLNWNPADMTADAYMAIVNEVTALILLKEGHKLPSPLPKDELPYEQIGATK